MAKESDFLQQLDELRVRRGVSSGNNHGSVELGAFSVAAAVPGSSLYQPGIPNMSYQSVGPQSAGINDNSYFGVLKPDCSTTDRLMKLCELENQGLLTR